MQSPWEPSRICLTKSPQSCTMRTSVLLRGESSLLGEGINDPATMRHRPLLMVHRPSSVVLRPSPGKEHRTPVEDDAASGSSLRWATAAEDRYPLGTGSSADGRPGRGRSTPQGADAGSIPERTLGWECPDGSLYLLPELARREVERVFDRAGSTASAAGRCTSSCPSLA